MDKLPMDPLKDHLEKLRAEQQRIRKEKKEYAKAVKLVKRKQQRLRHRIRLMSDDDLVAALMLRREMAQRIGASTTEGGDEGALGSSSSSTAAHSDAAEARDGDTVLSPGVLRAMESSVPTPMNVEEELPAGDD